MKGRLFEFLKALQFERNKKADRVLELMAGCGRNYDVFNRFFKNIEMIEQSPKMTKFFNEKIRKHQVKVQEFNWPYKYYDNITCIWGFCYLDNDEQVNLLRNMDQALKDGAHAIIFEPILSAEEEQKTRIHVIEKQQMAIRPVALYDTFFKF